MTEEQTTSRGRTRALQVYISKASFMKMRDWMWENRIQHQWQAIEHMIDQLPTSNADLEETDRPGEAPSP